MVIIVFGKYNLLSDNISCLLLITYANVDSSSYSSTWVLLVHVLSSLKAARKNNFPIAKSILQGLVIMAVSYCS